LSSKLNLGVEGHHVALVGDHQWVDLEQRGVEVVERPVAGEEQLCGLARDLTGQPKVVGDFARVVPAQADAGAEANPDNRFGGVSRGFLDIDAALAHGERSGSAGFPVVQDRKVVLALDGAAGFDIDSAHLASLRAGLGGDQGHAQNLVGGFHGLGNRTSELHAARLAASAHMDLRLDHHDLLVEPLRDPHGFVGFVSDIAGRNLDAVFGEKLLGLVFVNVHGEPGDPGFQIRPGPVRLVAPVCDGRQKFFLLFNFISSYCQSIEN
jgi:hypothetical protein